MLIKSTAFILVTILILTEHSCSQSSSSRDVHEHNVRNRRALGLSQWGFFETLGNMGRIVVEQYDDTRNTLQRLLDLLTDQFSDTATPSSVVQTTTPSTSNATTTEKYRITRKELGRILGRNYRGLRKLFNIEINDALNQSKYSIQDYQREYANAVVPIGKTPPTTTTTTTTLRTTTTTEESSDSAETSEDSTMSTTTTDADDS